MEIGSADGAWLRMRPVGYQSGVETPQDPAELDDWDDWLVIAVEAAATDGRTWSFSSPCLTTDEAGELARWLRGHTGDEPVRGTGPDTPMLFTEPNLAFRAKAAPSGRRSVQVDFSHESLPPWSPGSGLGRVYSLWLEASADVLDRAAAHWADEIAQFPRRAA